MDEDYCPICKSQKYLNPTMSLLVGPCSHKMCGSCVDRLFLGGPAPCPTCGTILRKVNFVSQKFEDLRVEKEIQIRMKLTQTYNKRLEDFKGDLRAYNNYLEETEDILYNLSNSIDYQDTMRKIKDYQLQNKDSTKLGVPKQSYDDRENLNKNESERTPLGGRDLQSQTQSNLQVNSTSLQDLESSARNKMLHSGLSHDMDRVEDSDLLSTRGISYDEIMQEQFRRPIDFIYRSENLPKIMPFYHDPWLSSLKIDDPNTARLLAAGGFEGSLTYTRAITTAFTGIEVGLDKGNSQTENTQN